MAMHPDEIAVTPDLIRHLLSQHFPKWQDLPLSLIQPEGTDNVMYKLGDDKVIRLPRTPRSVPALEKEITWLPKFSTELPLEIPQILAQGPSTEIYPLPWVIMNHVSGQNPSPERQLDQKQAAKALAQFINSLRKTSTEEAPLSTRGFPLSSKSKEVGASLPLLAHDYDTHQLRELWEKAVATPQWKAPPQWLHSDLHAGNILAKNGKISAIVDFGNAGIGDPSADLMVAWTLLNKESRSLFKAYLAPDENSWQRGRGWALFLGIVAYPYYKKTNPSFAKIAKIALDQILDDIYD